MFIEKEYIESCMERLLKRFDITDSKIENIKVQENNSLRIDGELLLDNQDLCMQLKVSKRTLQRYRSSGELKYRLIHRKTYYLESDVKNFLNKHF